MTDKILLGGAQFFGHHGVSDEERQTGGRYVVDVELVRDQAVAAASDNLADTISYADVYRVAREIVEGKSFRLVESLADAIAQELLARFAVDQVMVRVKKSPPPIDGIVEYAGVEIRREAKNVK